MPIDLRSACKRGNLEAVRAALTRGEDVNRKDRGCTPLMYAVMYKKNSTVRLLLEQPALDLNLAVGSGYTALHHAGRCSRCYLPSSNPMLAAPTKASQLNSS